ncbi:MAG: LPS export ABC transporter periplasmic protein LptC [Bacteroidetes bacterium]|uniref:LPS export ABC transporter periplasmic protein LptC n=1 Tax=Candidatus Cryptobacteroides excrementavium TaxID=2840759 RepID=A0A9D9NRI1_9BACT|nr:LPS export ABC transporter periplasmic protein LptC [Candidatus Cryptobacteroides excrementavium]
MKTAATAIAVAFVVYSCKSNLGVADSINLDETPVQTVDDMFVVFSENGRLQMRMEADVMERYDRDTMSYELFPEGFAVYGYDEDGLLETEITSDNARHEKYEDDGRETWQAFGNVVVKNIINKEVMETDTLYWDRKNSRIYTDCYVKMYSPDGFIQGYGMESDERARNTVILKVFDNYAFVVQDSTAAGIDSVNFIGPLIKK